MNKFIKKPALYQGAYVLVDQGMISVGMFMVGILLARAVSKEEYGVYVLGWSVITIVGGIHRAMVVLPYTVYSPKMNEVERSAYQNSGIVHTIVIGMAAIVALALWVYWNQALVGEVRRLMIETLPLLSLIPIPYLMREYMRSALFARLEFIDGAKVNIIASSMLVMAILVAYVYDHLNLTSAYTYIAVTSALASGALIFRHSNNFPEVGRLWIDIKRNFKLGKWLLVNAVAFGLVSQVSIWLLLYFEGAVAVAVFGACLMLSTLLAPFVRAVNAYLLPKMAHSTGQGSDASSLRRLLRVSLVIVTIPYLLWLIIGVLFAEQVMNLFYTGKYAGYGILLTVLILKTTIDSISTPATSALQSIERPDVTTVSLIMGAIVAVAAGYFLTEQMGLIGAGIATCVSTSVITGWKWFRLLRITAK